MSKKSKTMRRSRKNLIKKIKNTTTKVIPVVKSGLSNLGSSIKNAAKDSTPYIKKGAENIYGVLATGFNMGIDGVEKGMSSATSYIKKTKKNRKSRRSRRYSSKRRH